MNSKISEAFSSAHDVTRREDHHFEADLDILIEKAEALRLERMKERQKRLFISTTLIILLVFAGAAGFGWFLLVETVLDQSFLWALLALIPPVLAHFWALQPLKAYERDYKEIFLPQLAKALGGLAFYPNRGISTKMIRRTEIVPPFTHYEAEDCFMGRYQGVKVLLSEARLYNKSRKHPVFDGLFVLLETPGKIFRGHTIITADYKMASAHAHTRWRDFGAVDLPFDVPDWGRFQVFSDNPGHVHTCIKEDLAKELTEAARIFDEAALSAVLFNENLIFLMIPYKKDMFEPSGIHVPITTKQMALNAKREIEQILEIVDVFELYKTNAEPRKNHTT